MTFHTTEQLIADIKQGKMVVLLDDENRENEGDLVLAAEAVTAEHINFMAQHARGLICLALTAARCEQLHLPLMVADNRSVQKTKFTLSIEAASGVTTGISAADRAHTIHTAIAAQAQPEDVVRPGHIFPLQAEDGGVLSRAGHTEASCDLARLAQMEPAAVIVEIMNPDGSMARQSELEAFAKKHQLKIGTIADLIHYRLANEKTVTLIESGTMNTDYGTFQLHHFCDTLNGGIHLALTAGTFDAQTPVPVRVHVPSLLRDMCAVQFDHQRYWSVSRCLKKIAQEGLGVLVLLNYCESPDDVLSSIKVVLGQRSVPKLPIHSGAYIHVGIGAQILSALGVTKMSLMATNPGPYTVKGFGLDVVNYIPYDGNESQ